MGTVETNIAMTKLTNAKSVHACEAVNRLKKKPVSLSFDDAQLAQIDGRATQSGAKRSGQVQRDLTAYWMLLRYGMRRIQMVLSLDEAYYIARIFKGRVLVASDDVLWCDSLLCAYVRQSRTYADPVMAETVAIKIEKCDHLARLALMDWIRRAAVSSDALLFEGFVD